MRQNKKIVDIYPMDKSKKSRKLKSYNEGFSILKLFLFLFLSTVLVVGAVMFVSQGEDWDRVNQKALELEDKEAQTQRQYEDILLIQQRVGTMAYVEEIARQQLGMVNGDEVIFKRETNY